jgi:hypothetical protein
MGLPTRQAGVRFPAAKSVCDGDNEAMAMTEQEWLTSSDWLKLWFYSSEVGLRTERKTRLFASAACRRFANRLVDPRSIRALELCELYAEGSASEDELEEGLYAAELEGDARQKLPYVHAVAAAAVRWLCHQEYKVGRATEAAPIIEGYEALIAAGLIPESADESLVTSFENHPTFREGVAAGEAIQANFLREVICNPFHPVTINPAWRTSNVTALAQSIYDDRAFDRLPILADALEDAGCDNADILNHCRQPGEHVRGCWVVDLVLGRE